MFVEDQAQSKNGTILNSKMFNWRVSIIPDIKNIPAKTEIA